MSSLASLALANVYRGLSAYAAANAYLDQVVASERVAGLSAVSLQMANVGGQGSGAMANDQMASMPGMVRIQIGDFANCVAEALSGTGFFLLISCRLLHLLKSQGPATQVQDGTPMVILDLNEFERKL